MLAEAAATARRGVKFWTPERLVDLADMLCRMSVAEAAREIGRHPSAISALCAHHGITPGERWQPQAAPVLTRVRCLGPGDSPHWFASEDPRRERVCDACRGMEVFRAA